MSIKTSLLSLFRYKIWADDLLFEGIEPFRSRATRDERDTVIRLIDHGRIVSEIFLSHLQGVEHSHTATEAAEAPELAALKSSLEAINVAYIEYIEALDAARFEERVGFRFTDGSTGTLSREEMLLHVATHSGYHRGEVGRLMTGVMGHSPRDTFTGFLHEVEPARRM